MMSATFVDTEEPVIDGVLKEKESPSKIESEFQIKHSYELLDEELLDEQTPSTVQSVKRDEFKKRLENLECLLVRQDTEQAQIVAREIA